MRSNFNSASSINPEMAPNQPSWLAKHQNAAGNPEALQMLEAERSDLAGITKQYLDLSTVHGLRFIGEYNRSLCERIFWTIIFCMGGFFASYFILGIWQKWVESPVYMSVETTSHHVSNIPFPAVSICSVNKIQETRLKKSLKGLVRAYELSRETQLKNTYDKLNVEEMYFMLDSMIRYDQINATFQKWYSEDARNFESFVQTSDLLRVFRSSMQPCSRMLLYCKWQNTQAPCMKLFTVMTTDDGFCCVFNAVEQTDLLKTDTSTIAASNTGSTSNTNVEKTTMKPTTKRTTTMKSTTTTTTTTTIKSPANENDKTTLKSTTIKSTTTSMTTTTTTTEIIATSTTADEYDYEDEGSDEDDDWWNILDPTDYDIIGENCTTINGKEFCWPIYRDPHGGDLTDYDSWTTPPPVYQKPKKKKKRNKNRKKTNVWSTWSAAGSGKTLGKRSIRYLSKIEGKAMKDGIAINTDTMKHQTRRNIAAKTTLRANKQVHSHNYNVASNQYPREGGKKFYFKSRKKRQTSSKNKTTAVRPKMVTSSGAGQSMGLTLVLNADKNKYFMTSAFFEGFKVLVHSPANFPYVRERGFLVGLGQEVNVQVDATDVFSTSASRGVKSEKRNCLFYNERNMSLYENYTRSNCQMECSLKYTRLKCGCQPYFYPYYRDSGKVCGLGELSCLQGISADLRKISQGNYEAFKDLKDNGIECECPSACAEVSYRVELSQASFPNKMGTKSDALEYIKQRWKMGLKKLRNESTMIHIFFKDEHIIQFKRDRLYTIEDFVSNIGGLLGLWLGFSLLSVLELVYFFTCRWCCLAWRNKYSRIEDEDSGLEDVKSDVRNHQKAVFDHLFHKAPEKLDQLQKNFNQES